jgi:hypothetical protein
VTESDECDEWLDSGDCEMSQGSFSGLLSLKTAGCLVGAVLVEVVFGTFVTGI